MSLHANLNWNPTRRQLRQFALAAMVLFPAVAWIWGCQWSSIALVASAAAVLVAVSFMAPVAVKPLYLALSVLAYPIGLVIGEAILLIIFFAVFLPIGWALRLLRGDVLGLRFDRQAASYWQAKQPPNGAASYYRQS